MNPLRIVLLVAATCWLSLASSFANPTPAPLPAPTVDQRLADLEAYVNNAPRATDGVARTRLPGGGPGDSAWMMTSAALVLFMTLPGLALFYGGLVRRKNVLSILAQCLGLASVVTILWWVCGYSLAYARGGGVLGGWGFAFLRGVDARPNGDYAHWVPHSLFAVYQLMFAIITPALTVGAIAERMKFKAVMLFSVAWMFAVYFPVAHMIWGVGGLMNGLANPAASVHAIDFAGGLVVHMTSGWSALALCLVVGRRQGHGREPMPPHSMVLCMVGTGMLWAGWYGFNAGSALAADGIAVNAFVATTLAAAAGCFSWSAAECPAARQAQRAWPVLGRRGWPGDGDARRAASSRPGPRSSSAFSPAWPPTRPATTSRPGSATTMRWTPSASTPSAEPWAPS